MTTNMIQRGDPIVYDLAAPTLTGGANIACCPPLFDLRCSDGSVALFSSGGVNQFFLQWVGLKRATAKNKAVNYLQYMGGVKRDTTNLARPGVPAAICDPGDGTAFGEPCQAVDTCFGLVKTIGDPQTNGGNSLKYCESDPLFTVPLTLANGTVIQSQQITDEPMWHEANVSQSHINRTAYNLIWGVRDTTTVEHKYGHYGLWSLLQGYEAPDDGFNFVYECEELEPHLLDWGGNPACSSVQLQDITFDGVAIDPAYAFNLYATLRNIFEGLQARLARTRGMGSQTFNEGDVAIFAPRGVFECLIQCQVCYIRCGNDVTRLNGRETNQEIAELRRQGIGFGLLDFDGFRVPLIPFDPFIYVTDENTNITTKVGSFINDDGTYNMMMLVRGLGPNRVLQPEYNDLRDGTLPTMNDGFIQMYRDMDDICEILGMRTEWRWERRGSPFQTLIKNVACPNLLSDDLVQNPAAAESTCEPTP